MFHLSFAARVCGVETEHQSRRYPHQIQPTLFLYCVEGILGNATKMSRKQIGILFSFLLHSSIHVIPRKADFLKPEFHQLLDLFQKHLKTMLNMVQFNFKKKFLLNSVLNVSRPWDEKKHSFFQFELNRTVLIFLVSLEILYIFVHINFIFMNTML